MQIRNDPELLFQRTTQCSSRGQLLEYASDLKLKIYDKTYTENKILVDNIVKNYSVVSNIDRDKGQSTLFQIKSLKKGHEQSNEINALYDNKDFHFSYLFNELLQKVITTLIFYGQAYTEIILSFDTAKKVKHVDFHFLPNPKCIKKQEKVTFFDSLNWDETTIRFSVQNENLVTFSLDDLKIPRDFFITPLKKY